MKVELIPIKIKQRLNKLDSSDNPNLQCWHFVEAFNKAQLEWVRRQLHGGNAYRQGDESTKRRVDDLQILLLQSNLRGVNKEGYFESTKLPPDYLEFKRVSVLADSPNCKKRRMKVYLVEEANVDAYLANHNKRPDFNWAETFNTLINNKIRVYTDDRFKVADAILTYYRKPIEISLVGCKDIDDKDRGNVDPEFKDDIVELIIDEAAAILAADIESFNQFTKASRNAEKNN
jgi:hypothetical protein